MKKLSFLPLLAFASVYSCAQPIDVYPPQPQEGAQLLDGDWSFKYSPAPMDRADAEFFSPSFDASAWKKIRVPGNWELQGFAEPFYDLSLQDGIGLYRRTFRVPVQWRGGRRVCLRFEGVAYGFTAWVNGINVGASKASAYNATTLDITDALKPDPKAENILAVQVLTKPFAYEFDVNDDWSLGGIYRDVTLFPVPQLHIQDISTRTKVLADGAAEFSLTATISQPKGELRAKLVEPNGRTAAEFNLPIKNNHCETAVKVANPRLWTAETPNLYLLQLTLAAEGKQLQCFERRIGLREVSIADGLLKLNGRPIKLHGVDHHDLDPVEGRAITEANTRRDLELMKKANINFVRTSHYPPQPHFMELCDEMGFHVMCEVPIGKGEKHMSDPAYRENLIARTEATIGRDKNHPSVIVWSIGNENPVTDLLLECGRVAKQLDPTRPICYPTIGSYFEKNWELFPDFVDIYAPHYPSNSTLRHYATKLKRPLILTEYAHAWGLATDRIQDQWEIVQQTPSFAGAAIWHFQDQGILRTADKPREPGKNDGSVWLDDHRFFDTHNGDGCDGIVYSDRTPQTDFWETRKVYSPVQIQEGFASVHTGQQEITVSVENRYDFIALDGRKLLWSLQRNGTEIQKGQTALTASARATEKLRVPVNIPEDSNQDIMALCLRCVDEKGTQITERTLRLDVAGSDKDWLRDLPAGNPPKITDTGAEIKIQFSGGLLSLSRSSGELTILDDAGEVLLAGIFPHPGRKLTAAEQRSANRSGTWRESKLTEIENPVLEAVQDGANVRLAVSGTYLRPRENIANEPEKKTDDPLLNQESGPSEEATGIEAFIGGYQAEITSDGTIRISYDYAPTKGHFSEAGLSVVVPPSYAEFRWIGKGPYPGYPGKDRLNEFGLFHLNREDLRFQGNRRETQLAMLTAAEGKGIVMITSTPGDVSVERDGTQTLMSHNAAISGLGNKGSKPETFVGAENKTHFSGSFTLLLVGNQWPTTVERWFGQPKAVEQIFQPFTRSYDQ